MLIHAINLEHKYTQVRNHNILPLSKKPSILLNSITENAYKFIA